MARLSRYPIWREGKCAAVASARGEAGVDKVQSEPLGESHVI